MTEKTKQKVDKELQSKIRSLIEEKRLDLTTIARGINKSPSTLSLYMSDSYEGKIDTLEKDLRSYIDLFNKKEATENKSLKFVETSITKKLFKAANMCQLRGKIGVCFGAPGIGKTTAINEYLKSSSGVIVVDPFENTSTRAVLKQIAQQLKLNYNNNMSIDEFTLNVVKKLEKNKHLIIIDEAENLRIEVLKTIRKIHDKTKNSCGILLVGTYDIEIILSKAKSGFAYITSRIGYLEQLDALKLEDVEKLIKQYFPTCEDKLIQYIAKSTKFNARAIQNLLDLCYDYTQLENCNLETDIIDAAREKLLI